MSLYEKVKTAIVNLFKLAPSKTYVDPDNIPNNLNSQFWHDLIEDQLQRNAEDKIKYEDFDIMDAEIPEISVALDVMTDFVVYPDNVNKNIIFEVRSATDDKKVNAKIKEITERTRFPYEFHSMAREMCKYGDNVEEILFNKSRNLVMGFKNVPIESIIINMKNGIKQDSEMIKQMGSDAKPIATLDSNEAFHLSLGTDRRRKFIFGKGVSKIEKSRLIYRQLRLMEEGVMIKRLSTANQSFAITVDTGDLMGEEVFAYLDKYQKRISRRKYIDNTTGRLSYKINPLSALEDILIPTRQGSGGGNITALNNNDVGKNIEDLEYFQNKLIYSTEVPKLLLGKDEDVNSKSSSDIQYISFLRCIRRIQTLSEPEIIRFYQNALACEGIKDAKLKMIWPIFGTIDEERKWRIEQLKYDCMKVLSQDLTLVDDWYCYKVFLGMTDEEIETLTTRMDDEEKTAQKEFDDQIANADDLTNDPSADATFNTDNKQNTEVPVKTSVAKKKIKKERMEYFEKKLDTNTFKLFSTIISASEVNEDLRNDIISLSELIKLGGIK